MNIGVHISFWVTVLVFYSGYIAISVIVGWYCNSIFCFLKYVHTAFHSDCTYLHFHQQYTRASFPSHPCQHVLFVDSFCYRYSDRYEVIPQYGINLHFSISDVDHLFLNLLVICMYLEKCLFRSSAHFLIVRLFVWYWATWVGCIFWILIPCCLYHLQIFSPII